MFEQNINREYHMRHVKDLLDERGEWNMDILSGTFPQNIIDVILTEKPPNPDRGDDICIWKGNHSGLFFIKNEYDLIRCNDFDDN